MEYKWLTILNPGYANSAEQSSMALISAIHYRKRNVLNYRYVSNQPNDLGAWVSPERFIVPNNVFFLCVFGICCDLIPWLYDGDLQSVRVAESAVSIYLPRSSGQLTGSPVHHSGLRYAPCHSVSMRLIQTIYPVFSPLAGRCLCD